MYSFWIQIRFCQLDAFAKDLEGGSEAEAFSFGFACFLLASKVLESLRFSAAVFWCPIIISFMTTERGSGDGSLQILGSQLLYCDPEVSSTTGCS